jgi:diadenosine tetraphosphatase ApaH/serine/threonine PP2A family protein phosphatase
MFSRRLSVNRLELADPDFRARFRFARCPGFCHPAVMAAGAVAPGRLGQDSPPSPIRLPGPRGAGRFFADRARFGQSPADAGDLAFRRRAHALDSAAIKTRSRGSFPCVSPCLFLPLRPLPLAAAGRPTFSVPPLAPRAARSFPMQPAARPWSVRPSAALVARSATTSTSAADLIDSRLSIWPSLRLQGWLFHVRWGAAGEACSRRS